MTREQIETRIKFIEAKLAEATHVQDIKSLNSILEKLIMKEADDD
jgi:hypothetical protein